jgi:flavin reductase (DIM6/NTAB) family NADH-FMN oxidoreductase RutF
MQATFAGVAGHSPGPTLSLRHVLGHFATGVTVVSYNGPEGPRGMTVNSFTSVSLDPPLVLACVDKRSRSIAHLLGRAFAVNVLHARQQELALHFSGRSVQGYEPEWSVEHAAPVLRDCLARLVCEPWTDHDAGDHVITVGRVTHFDASPKVPLCFFRGRFMELATASAPLAT